MEKRPPAVGIILAWNCVDRQRREYLHNSTLDRILKMSMQME